MGENWPFAIAVVGLQLAFTLVIGPLTQLREARQTELLRQTAEVVR